MFSGIVECLGIITRVEKDEGNITFEISSRISHELKIDQSVSHNGACLTVIRVDNDKHSVTAIEETLVKTNLKSLNIGDKFNLERCIRLGDRLDGHMVQGHVDQIGVCAQAKETNGSWLYEFEYDQSTGNVTVEKGSVCVNGVSLTVVNSLDGKFSVAIIPYTYTNTTFKEIVAGTDVNLEFDILGKYISKLMSKDNLKYIQ